MALSPRGASRAVGLHFGRTLEWEGILVVLRRADVSASCQLSFLHGRPTPPASLCNPPRTFFHPKFVGSAPRESGKESAKMWGRHPVCRFGRHPAARTTGQGRVKSSSP